MIFYTLTLSRKWLADNNGLVPSVATGYENLESFDYTQRTKVDVRATVYIFVNCKSVNFISVDEIIKYYLYTVEESIIS